MADGERLTITLPAEMAAVVREAVAEGDYVSASDVVRAALSDWTIKRALESPQLAALKADIDLGLADIAAGRVKAFNIADIIARGRTRSDDSSSSA